jgi:hypothetical protein
LEGSIGKTLRKKTAVLAAARMGRVARLKTWSRPGILWSAEAGETFGVAVDVDILDLLVIVPMNCSTGMNGI